MKTILYLAIFPLLFCLFHTNNFAQDSLNSRHVILLEKKSTSSWLSHTRTKIFQVGQRICIKYKNNDSVIRGRIKQISDSTILIKNIKINVKDITRINDANHYPLLLGGIELTTGIVLFIIGMNYDNGFEGGVVYVASFIMIFGSQATLLSLEYEAFKPYYHINKPWKISIIEEKMSKKFKNKFPLQDREPLRLWIY